MVPESVRDDFPILSRTVHGKRLVYLDSAATSQKPRRVIDALVRYYTTYNANVHRGIYEMAEEATRRYEESRATLAASTGARRPECAPHAGERGRSGRRLLCLFRSQDVRADGGRCHLGPLRDPGCDAAVSWRWRNDHAGAAGDLHLQGAAPQV